MGVFSAPGSPTAGSAAAFLFIFDGTLQFISFI
jgi:hypothetical protein